MSKVEKQRCLAADAWMFVASECYGMTLREIESMKPGSRTKVVLMHDNVMDATCSPRVNKPLKVHKPETFFRHEIATFIKGDQGIEGIFRVDDADADELCIEVQPNNWSSLTKGRVKRLKSLPDNISGKHWREFSPSTKIGWRGAMIPYKNMASLPLIYYQA